MAVNLERMLNFKGNMFALTNAVIHRGKQLMEIGDEDLQLNNGKIVTTALNQILTEKIEYTIEE